MKNTLRIYQTKWRKYIVYFISLLTLSVSLNSCATLSKQEYLDTAKEEKLANIDESKFVILDNGLEMRYTKSGNGEPLLMVHHVRGQLEYFDKIKPDLEKHFTVYAVDLPGHGASSIPDTTYTAQFYKKALYDFVKKMKLTEATFLGESIGASLVLSLPSYEDVDPKSVIAINPYDGDNGIENGNGFARFLIWTFKTPLRGMTSSIRAIGPFKKVLKGGYYDTDKLNDSLVETYLLTGKRKGHRKAFVSTIRKFETFSELQKDYKKNYSPTLIIHGETDWLPIEVRENFFNDISNLKRVTIEQAGHFASQERPEKVLEAISAFLK